jgi:hypothetical protein
MAVVAAAVDLAMSPSVASSGPAAGRLGLVSVRNIRRRKRTELVHLSIAIFSERL